MNSRAHTITLVSLPWTYRDRPSAALGMLAAYVRQERPEWDVRTYHAYVDFADKIGADLYKSIADHNIGEPLALQFLYPEKKDSVRNYFQDWLKKVPSTFRKPGDPYERVTAGLADLIEQTARHLVGQEVVGFTTSYCQLFLNLKVAQRLKELSPKTQVMIGGTTVSGCVGPSMLKEYSWIDFVVQGEGERPLLLLLDAIGEERAAGTSIHGVLRRSASGQDKTERPDRVPLDQLPVPDYDEFAALAEKYGVVWSVPLQGSRGCWWDRTEKTKDPKSICHFCTVSALYEGYTERSVGKVVAHMDALSRRHHNANFFFVDDIMRAKNVEHFAREIASHGRDYQFFHEIRASVRPYDLFLLKEAGLKTTQIGIEGLSSSYLRRIGKGTTAIQNLQALRGCAELGIKSKSNLITEYPGATAQEIEETRRNILDYAISYEPLTVSKFGLYIETTAVKIPEMLGIVNVRNSEEYLNGMPQEVWERLELYELDFETTLPRCDWGPVYEAREEWIGSYNSRPGPTLTYQDGGTFLNIQDRRRGGLSEIALDEQDRDLYLYCTEIRSFDQLLKRYERSGGNEELLRSTLQQLCALKVMFQEGNHYLSLAVALTPAHAKRRIEALHAEESLTPLQVVA